MSKKIEKLKNKRKKKTEIIDSQRVLMVISRFSVLRVRKGNLVGLWKPEFIGNTFGCLELTMNAFDIKYELYFNGEIVSKNHDSEADLRLISQSPVECKNLKIAENQFDIFFIPTALKRGTGGAKIENYVTRLDEVIGGEINPDPLNGDQFPDLFNIEDTYEINLQIWRKWPTEGTTTHFEYAMIYNGSKYERTAKFHFVDGWGIFIHIQMKKGLKAFFSRNI